MKLGIMTAALAAVSIVSGCAANDTKTAGAGGASAVTAHETTGETAAASASEKAIEVSLQNMTESRNLDAAGTDEIDISQLLEDEKEAQSDTEEDNDYIAPDDTIEDSDKDSEKPEEKKDEEKKEDEEEEDEEEEDEEEEDEDNDGLYLDDSSEYIGALSPIDNGTYPCSVILVCTAEDTTAVMIQELISKYGLGIVYDYNELNMYAFSTPEPLDREATKKLLDELTEYDFILSAEPDQVIYLDDPVLSNPEINGPIEL